MSCLVKRSRGRGLMESLARARPASLDGAQGAAEKIAVRLAAAGAPLPAQAAGRPGGADRRSPLAVDGMPLAADGVTPFPRRLRRGMLAGAGFTVTAAAAAVAVVLATAGGNAPARRESPAAGSPVLTAAMVRQMASASRSALALSGRATIAYRTTRGGVLQESGSDDITFSGRNWDDVISQTFAGTSGRPAHTQTAINRIVDGRTYYYFQVRSRQPEWVRDTNPSGKPSIKIPDPRTLLRALEPAARFRVVGRQEIGGIWLKVLRASDPSHLTGLGSLPDVPPAGHTSSLTVWVDGHGVVHRIGITSRRIVWIEDLSKPTSEAAVQRYRRDSMALKAALTGKQSHSSWVKRMTRRLAQEERLAFHSRQEAEVTTVTVTFSSIGQPQHITAPPHATAVYGRG